MDKFIVTFGEIMGRLEPEGHLRFRQGMPGNLRIGFYGAEANAAVSLKLFGRKTRFVTVLPDNALGDACEDSVRRFGVDTSRIIRRSGRLGLYYVETGANQRASNVIYDREGSAIALTPPSAYDWDAVFADTGWFHITGITPAVSVEAAAAALEAVKRAKELGLSVSCDLNYRKKLWNWEPGTDRHTLAGKTMRAMLPFVDLLVGNEEDAYDILGIQAGSTDVTTGHLAVDRYPEVAKSIVAEFPNIAKVAFTLRESVSASHNNLGAMLYDARTGEYWFSPLQNGEYTPYQIRNIVDRVGGGDAFAAGLIYALTDGDFGFGGEQAAAFAAAASCLAHSIQGDFNFVSTGEVLSLMRGNASGRVVR